MCDNDLLHVIIPHKKEYRKSWMCLLFTFSFQSGIIWLDATDVDGFINITVTNFSGAIGMDQVIVKGPLVGTSFLVGSSGILDE